MKIKTELLKELVGKAINGASNNKLIPITQLMGIKKTESNIMLTTTDATNYLYVKGEVEPVENDMQVTVFAEQFAKLVSKMTCNDIYLTLKDNTLEVKGNGTYTLELPLDENGELIKYPDHYAEIFDVNWEGTIKPTEIKTIIDSVKPSLSTTMEMPAITNYFVGDKVIATDRYKIASFDNKMLLSDEVLMSSQLMDLLNLATNDIKYFIGKTHMLFDAGDMVIYSKGVEDISEYPIDALENLIATEFKSVCKVNKNSFIALLERISLFIGKYDDSAVRLYFETDGIRVSNKNRKSNELIEYSDSKNYKAYDCVVNVNMLLSQLKAYAGDVVELHYNSDKVIKFVDGAMVQIIALMEE
jgi:DNA polymerase III sliding clamp (beta) subunit (PCNA family)